MQLDHLVLCNMLTRLAQEMVISAPHSGKVGDLRVKEGDSVDGRDLVCRIVKWNGHGGHSINGACFQTPASLELSPYEIFATTARSI